MAGAPRFSILTPVHETPAEVLEATLASVRAQRYRDWELCAVDDGSAEPHVGEILARSEADDARIRVKRRNSNGGIVAASNDALAMARGEFVALLDHDDELHPKALKRVAAALDAKPETDYLYTDEDKIDAAGRHSGPFFKPDWSPERLRTQMYTCHLSVLRRALVEEVGGFDPEYEGSQDWDLVLKVAERARAVAHVPEVLYHWRALASSAAGGGETAKPWAFEAGRRAVQAHCDRTGLPARVERDEADPGIYHLRPALREQPPVSIVIPTAGARREVRFEQVTLVTHCVRSIVESSTYEDYEIVVVADEGTDPETLAELERIGGGRLRLVAYDGPFNFSAKVNLGAAHAAGEQLLLLNDDIEVATPEWIERLVMYAGLPGVGAVGCRLLAGDGRLQHAGVGFEGGLPGHPYHGFSGGYRGYSNNVRVARDCLAVTAACMMTPRALFEQLGGFTEELPLNYNDADYCLKAFSGGKRIVYDPDTAMYHFESSTRPSAEVDDWEKKWLRDRWLPVTAKDPYSNPNLRRGEPRLVAMLATGLRGLQPRRRAARR